MSTSLIEPSSGGGNHTASSAVAKLTTESPRLQRRSFFAWLIDRLYGYDVFISYTRLDDPQSQYSNALFVALTERGLRCFLDLHEIDRDQPLDVGIAAKVRASRTLVILAGGAAGDRRAVLDE